MLSRFNRQLNHHLNRLAAIMIALLGFSSCSDDEEDIPDVPLMYGVLTPTFEVKGTVTNVDNQPIGEALIYQKIGAKTEEGLTFHPSGVTKTDKEGKYTIQAPAFNQYYLRIIAIDEATQAKDSAEIQIPSTQGADGKPTYPDQIINITLKESKK